MVVVRARKGISRLSAPAKLPGNMREHEIMCPECGASMKLRKSSKYERWFYGCSKYPDCKGTHGAHPNGAPLGKPATQVVKKARMAAHDALDRLWDGPEAVVEDRNDAYKALRTYYNWDSEECHIGEMDEEGCQLVIEFVEAVLDDQIDICDLLSSFEDRENERSYY